MHPLPPPPGRAQNAKQGNQQENQQENQRTQSQPPIAPQTHGHTGEVPPEQGQSSSQAKPKRRKHRGGKKKRNRRQSFAVPSEDISTLPSVVSDAHAEHVGGHGHPSAAGNRPFYQLGRASGNLSNTSLDSEALLDHRDQPSLRPRRESRVAQSMFSAYRSSPPKHRWESGPSSYTPYRWTPRSNPYAYNQESDDGQEAHDRAPLLGNKDKHDIRGSYGTPSQQRLSPSPLRRESQSSESSRRRHKGLSREASYGQGHGLDYDVNNPPSIPNSPKLGGEMGYDDVMVGSFAVPRPPDTRRDEPNDAFINIDGPERQNSAAESTPPTPRLAASEALRRRRTMTLPVEEDVCFPLEGMSEIAEEDFPRNEPSETGRGSRRRRRRWPDLSILEEWSAQEKEERSEGLRQMRISEPTLVNGRLRASKVAWHRMEEERPYRFTYFNEEFEGTIHAQTISELVQPGGSFRELFIPEPPELEDSTSEESEADDQVGPKNGNGHEDRVQSPKPSVTRHSSIIGEQKSNSQEDSGTGTPRKWDLPKPKRYGPRPTFWLDVLSPTEDEMRVISKAFGIHALTAEDILLQEAREKVELFRNYYFINYRSFEQDVTNEEFLEPVNIYVVVFREGVLSFHFSQTPHPANVRRRIRQLKDYLILSSDWISYAIIDDITDVFQPLIQNIEEEVDDIDDLILAVFEDPTSAGSQTLAKDNRSIKEKGSEVGEKELTSGMDMLRRIGQCRKKVMGLYRLLGNKADVIKGFAKRCNEQWEVAPKSEIGLYLGDIQDHILTMTSNLGHYETLLSRAHSNYLAQVNIRMSDRAEQNADILGKLTVLGTIVLPLNVICGMFGMNTKVPGQEIDNLNWFWGLTGGMAMFAILCYLIAKRVYRIV